VKLLAKRGWQFVGPDVGPLAEGPSARPGRMSEPEHIFATAARLLGTRAAWAAKRVLVTAGPTREHLDPVRVITNPSSGRMGYALAEAAWQRGAEVTLVSGPVDLAAPYGVVVHRVETTDEMQKAVQAMVKKTDALFMAAAPADYKPKAAAKTKRPRGADALTLTLEGTQDILASLTRPAKLLAVGFALETGGGIDRAKAKLRAKRLDYIVLNDALEPGAGFEVSTNRVTIIANQGEPLVLPLLSKREVADRILDAVERALT
jgi:phosphopantothenoylcysteine decarboxylase/phosphopantothenate--cysteine ligase